MCETSEFRTRAANSAQRTSRSPKWRSSVDSPIPAICPVCSGGIWGCRPGNFAEPTAAANFIQDAKGVQDTTLGGFVGCVAIVAYARKKSNAGRAPRRMCQDRSDLCLFDGSRRIARNDTALRLRVDGEWAAGDTIYRPG